MNAIKLIHHVVEGELNIGESKLWGDPDLPHSFDFPVYKDEEGDKVHYTFIGQINCTQAAPYDKQNRLPKEGMLYFFGKIEYYLGDFLCDPVGDAFWKPGDVKVLYYPRNDYENFERVVLIDDDDNPISIREHKIDFEAVEDQGSEYDTKLLGLPAYLADDVDLDKYTLLLQLDSDDIDDEHTLNFMDWGQLLFLIPTADLERPSFKNVIAYLASS